MLEWLSIKQARRSNNSTKQVQGKQKEYRLSLLSLHFIALNYSVISKTNFHLLDLDPLILLLILDSKFENVILSTKK